MPRPSNRADPVLLNFFLFFFGPTIADGTLGGCIFFFHKLHESCDLIDMRVMTQSLKFVQDTCVMTKTLRTKAEMQSGKF